MADAPASTPEFKWPKAFTLSKAVPWPDEDNVINEVQLREPKIGHCLDTGVLDDNRAANMLQFMAIVAAQPPSFIERLAVADYIGISRYLNGYLNHDSGKLGNVEWPIEVRLQHPIKGEKSNVTSLTLREPRTMDFLKAGLLDAGASTANLATMIEISADVDRKIVREMTLPDFNRAARVFSDFLLMGAA